MVKPLAEDLFNFGVADHIPETIRAKQENIAGLKLDGESINFDHRLLTQTATHLITLGMGIDILRGEDSVLNQTSDH
jgi:hypothetical protein